MPGRRSTQFSGSSSSSSAFTNDVDWFLSLLDVSLQCLELGKIIQRTCCSTVFAHKSSAQKVIKAYKFSETYETLNQSKWHYLKIKIQAVLSKDLYA